MFVVSANLQKRGHMIDILANMAPNLTPNSPQNRAKAVKKSMQKLIRFLTASGTPFWWILIDVGSQLGGETVQISRPASVETTFTTSGPQKSAPECCRWPQDAPKCTDFTPN